VQRDLGWTEADAAASHQRVAPIWKACMPRRRGLIGALLDAVLEATSGRGCRLAQITTYIENDAARSAYEKSGFRILDEKRCSEVQEILGVPGFVRLTRKL